MEYCRPKFALSGFQLVLLACLAGCGQQEYAPAPSSHEETTKPSATALTRPNILIIVADDLGYSDLGSYGSEIATPNLDALANESVRFTQFNTSPMCSTTRSMLLTGVDHHLAGFGNLTERLSDNQKGQPGYEGYLNQRVVTIGEILQDAGYNTYMTGKWHLGIQAGPAERGFDRSFALMDSGAGHFNNRLPVMGPEKAIYLEDGQEVETLHEDFYSSRFYARKMVEYMASGKDGTKPFFGYLAFTAPHFPLQAPAESIAHYRGKYDQGFDVLHQQRLKRMQALGLVDMNVIPFPALDSQRPWDELTQQEQLIQSRTMEIYAAMISDLDRYVGEVLDYLETNGLEENTLVFFMSDNGAEGHYLEWGLNPLAGWAKECCNNDLENMGKPDSYLMLGPDWGRVAQAPFRMFKGFTSEGGVRVPAFVRYPAVFDGGRFTDAWATVKDVVPSLLEIAGVTPPEQEFRGRSVIPVQGRSLLPMLKGDTDKVHADNFVMGWEIFGKRAVRQGDWKILRETDDANWWDPAAQGISRDAWQLYHLPGDPAELSDVSAANPQQLEAMIELWDVYAAENGVIIPDKQRGY
jgi:arylsulfatase